MNGSIKQYIIKMVFKVLAWRDENKNWERLLDELLQELLENDNEYYNVIALKIIPLKYLREDLFKKRIFEVINYVECL